MEDRTQAEIDWYTLPERRRRQVVGMGGLGVTHVVRFSTFKGGRSDGRWTRRAADRITLCGSLKACLIGLDATDWPTDFKPLLDAEEVSCRRCVGRYEKWLARHAERPGGPDGT